MSNIKVYKSSGKRGDTNSNVKVVVDYNKRLRDSQTTVQGYYDKINNKEYLSPDDIINFKSNLDRYIDTTNYLRKHSTYTDEENAKWDEDVKGMNDYYDAWSSFYGGYADEEDFKARGVNDIWNSQFYAKYGDMSYDEFEEAMTSVREQYNAAKAPSLDGNTFREVPEELEREYKYLQDYYDTYTEKDKYLKEHGDLYATVSQDDGARGWAKFVADDAEAKRIAVEGKDDEKWWETIGRWLGDGGVVDTTLTGSNSTQAMHGLRNDESHRRPDDNWTREQRFVFGSLYLESPELAYDYAEKTNIYNNTVAEEKAKKKIYAAATKNFGAGLGHTLGAIATAPLGMADYLADLTEANVRGKVTPDGNISPFEYSQAVTESISTNLNEISGVLDESIPILGGKGLGDVYGLGTSILQSAASAYTLGPAGTLISYFGQGAAAGMDDALARGATPGQAAIYGTALGVFEGVAESIGIDNLFKIGASSTVKEFIINTLKQAGAEGLEEGLTSILSNITDAVVMQDKSNFDALVEQYKANGMSDKDAKWKVFWESVEGILFDAFGGAVSGGVHGGAHTLAQTGVNAVKQAQTGKAIRNTPGLTDAMMARASEMENTKANDIASGIRGRLDGGKRVGNMAYGKLYSSMSDSQISSTFQAQLGENSRGIADTITDLVKGREVSDKALRSLMASEKGLSILNETLGTSVSGENSLKDVRKSIGDALDVNTAQRAAEVGVEAFRGMSRSQAAAKIESRLSTGKGQISDKVQRQKLAATVADIVKGEDVSRSDINAALSNERARNVLGEYLGVKLTEKSSAKDVRMAIAEQQNDHSPRSQAKVYAAILNMDSNGTRGLASIVENTSGDIGDVAQAYNALYRAGVNGMAINEAKNKHLSLLTPEQRQYAYQTGVVDGLMERGRKNSSGEANADQDQNAAETKSKQSKEEKDTPAFLDEGKVNEAQAKVDAAKRSDGKKKKGAVIYDGDRSKLSDMQKKSLDVLDKVAEALGVTFRIYESERVNGRLVYKMPDGVVKSANGWYDPKTGEIWLDINAGLNGEGTLIFTAAHELTHFIKQWSPAKFKIFADFLIEQYGERGISIDELVQRRIDKAKKKGEDIDPDTAYEEVIADSCETFLRDSNAAEKIAELHQKDASLAQKIKQFLSGMLKRLRELMKGMDPDSLEGKVVAEMTGSLEQLHKLWTDALADAGEAYSGAESVVNSEGGVKEQARNAQNTNVPSNRTFSYNELVSKGDLLGVIIDKSQQVKLTANGSIDLDWVLSEVRGKCNILQTKSKIPTYYTNVPDIGKNVEITREGIKHGFIKFEAKNGQKVPPNSLINARIALEIPSLLNNSIEVNRSQRGSNSDILYTSVLVGTVALEDSNGNLEYYAVRSMIEQRANKNPIFIEANVLGKLYATKAKKIGLPTGRGTVKNSVALASGKTYTYSIADFLQDVKGVFDDTFSNDVYAHFNMQRYANDFSANLMYSDRDYDASTNREILANLLETDDMTPSEKGFLTKYKNKIAQIEANEAEIAAMESELKELRKAGKKDSSRAIALEGKIEARRKEIARDENMILNLESTNSIKRLLKSEKDAAYAEGMLAGQMAQGRQDAAKLRRAEERLTDQKRRSDETLAEYKKRVAEREADIKQKNREKLAEQKRQARQDVEDAHLAGQMAQGRIDAAKLATAKRALDEQAKRYQESRKKATEGRHKTAMRHKIAGVVSELDKLLRKGTKERNVKIGLRDAVAAALELFDMNEEKVERYNKAIADLDARIAATTDPVEIEALTALREKKVRNGDRLADKLQVMKKAYEDIHNGRDGENYPSYYKAECEAIENRIAEVMEKVGDTSIGEMSLEQLEAVYGMYRMVLTTVQNANKVFKNGKLADLTADAADMTSELQRIKKLAEERLKAGDDIRSFVWNELTPYYAFNRIGSETLMSYYEELIRGQDVYARDIEEAKKFAEDTRKKHGYGKWKLDQVYNFKDKDGRDFRLTLRHMMSIYAYSKREQALDHMENGGFFFNNKETFRKKAGVLEFIASNESGYKVDARIFAQIKGTLTAEQIAYVDEMQAYLTKMGEKGNEVTRVMWGIDIFKEAVYFPLKSKEDFIYQANTPAETSSLKNDGMTKETRPHASNPIVLESFDDVWANHVEKMSKYHGFVIPIDNLNKLVNYGTWMSGEAETHAESHSHQNRDLVSKRLSASDLKEYLNAGSRQNKSKVRALNDGKQLILTSENEIADFIDDSIKGEHGLTTVAYGRVADRLSSDVDTYSKGKIDISNYYLELVPNDINHAFKEHTNAKQDGDIDLSLNDFHNIPNYLDNYDELVYAIQFESGATRICVSKKIDTGRVILIETVSKSRGSIEFKNIIGVSEEKYNSAYKDKYKKGNKPNSGGSRSSNISPLDEFVSNNSIPPSDKNVNRNFSTNSEMGSHSISTMLEARFGPGVNEYLNTFIKDLNGAKAQSGGFLGSAFNLLSKFKKTSVAASLSVVVQQPTAIIRALSEIDVRYFVGMPKPEILNRKWERMKKYAPIVILKDIGGFDAGSGRQITEWLNADTKRGVDKAMNKADDLTMYGAALGDRIGWASIWTAVEREVQAKQKPEYGSEAFYEAVGKRFTEVIVKTQVYDSTLSRSGFMRGKDGLMKMATAFMGEPTLSVNMMADAILQAKRGKIKKAKAVRVIASVYVATVAASIVKSLIYALRDDDEDESYAEKYLQALGGEMRLNLNPLTMPLTMLPIFRDVVSIFDGWDVERTDMALVADLKNAIDALNSDTKSTWRKIEDFAGAIAAFAGVPLKNVMRTAREIYNLFENVFDGIEGGDLGGAFGEGITGKEAGKRESLYNALISGDAERIGQYRANYDTEEKYLSAVRQALREYDPRVQRAVEGILSGDSGLYNEMKNAVKAEKYFDVKTVNNAFADEKEYVLGKLNDARKAKREGNTEEYNKIIKQLVERGYSEEFIKKKLK